MHITQHQEDVFPPPPCCRRCGNRFLDIGIFGRGRDWEISCFFCGDLWWTRRRKMPAIFQKYRYASPDHTDADSLLNPETQDD